MWDEILFLLLRDKGQTNSLSGDSFFAYLCIYYIAFFFQKEVGNNPLENYKIVSPLSPYLKFTILFYNNIVALLQLTKLVKNKNVLTWLLFGVESNIYLGL